MAFKKVLVREIYSARFITVSCFLPSATNSSITRLFPYNPNRSEQVPKRKYYDSNVVSALCISTLEASP